MVGKIPEVKVKLIFDSKAKAELKAITKEISDSFKHSPQLKDMIKSLDTLQIATHRLEVAMKSANIGGGKGSGGNFVGGMEAKSYFKELLKTLEDAKNQDQRDLFGSLERKLADVAKTIAIAVGKVGGKGGSTTTVKQGLTFEEQMALNAKYAGRNLSAKEESQRTKENIEHNIKWIKVSPKEWQEEYKLTVQGKERKNRLKKFAQKYIDNSKSKFNVTFATADAILIAKYFKKRGANYGNSINN